MKRVRNLLIGTVSMVALTALPLHLHLGGLGCFDGSVAYAKGGNGGGNGNGGNGNGKGKGGENGNAGGKSQSDKADRGKSASAKGAAKADDKDKTQVAGTAKKTSQDVKVAKAAVPLKTRKVVTLPETAPAPDVAAKVEDQNLHAKLAGLNSLQRNYHAYLNSQSARFAPVFDFVVGSAKGMTELDQDVLRQALLEAANENRVAQYGDNYLDAEVMDWATDVLGVGPADGKIDEVRETLMIDGK
jgi:hypothetical protein